MPFLAFSSITASPLKSHTLVPPHPNLKAASCANSSPKPSISPLTNGRKRLIAAPRSKLQNVGGAYKISAGGDSGDEDCGGEISEGCEVAYCSLSLEMVKVDSPRDEGTSWSAILRFAMRNLGPVGSGLIASMADKVPMVMRGYGAGIVKLDSGRGGCLVLSPRSEERRVGKECPV